MKSSTRDLILKIIGYLLFVLVILIILKYMMVIKNKDNTPSSQTINTVEENNQIIHTPIENNNNAKILEEEKEKLIMEITQKIKNKIHEDFTDSTCVVDFTKNIFYLYLQVQLLEGAKFKPQPIWTNKVFCLYKVKPIISLDYGDATGQESDTDYYYPLGDILLFKDYANYIANYNDVITKMESSKLPESCQTDTASNSNNNLTPPPSLNVNSNNEGFKGKVENIAPSIVPKPDSQISNYDQPGLKGLQVLVKNGKKPLGFESEPVTVIKGDNGENLYFWRPLAPEGYVFLGDMISMGATPNMPMVDSCHLRCVPKECLDTVNLQDRALVACEDIKHPYQVFTVANGKYFKGLIDNGLASNIISYDLNDKCLNVERDDTDTETKLVISIASTDGSGNPPSKPLNEGDFNLLKADYLVEIKKKIVLIEDLKLNNVLNNSDIDGTIFDEKNMRFRLETKFVTTNEFTLNIIFKKRAVAYGELKTIDLSKMIGDNLKEYLTYNFRSSGNEYTFVPTGLKEISMGMTPGEKELLVELQKAIQELEKQVLLEKEKKILPQAVLDHLDLLIIDCKSLENSIINSLVNKETLVKKCMDKIAEINSLVSSYSVVELKMILDKLMLILEKLQKELNANGNSGLTLNEKYMIDENLKNELEMMAKLAVRNASGAPAELDDYLKYHPQGISKSLSITELKNKENSQ